MKFIAGLAFLFISVSAFSQSTTLKLGSDVWPPFTNKPGEKSVAADLVQHALSEIKINSQIMVTDFDSVINNIKSGKFDGSAAIWKTPERETNLLFSEPYLQNQLILIGRKGANVNIYTADGLSGKRIGVVSSYAYDRTFLDSQDLKFTFSNSDQENLEKLLAGEIDYMLVDELLIQYLLKYQFNDVSNNLEISDRVFQTKPLYFAINKSTPDAEKIIAAFNKEIKKMMRNGTYNKILNLDWVKADVDDDGIPELVYDGTAAGNSEPNSAYSLTESTTEKNQVPSSFYINGSKYDNWDSVPDNYKKVEIAPTQKDYIPAVHFKF